MSEEGRAGQGRAVQGKAGLDRVGQSWKGGCRAGRGWAGWDRTAQNSEVEKNIVWSNHVCQKLVFIPPPDHLLTSPQTATTGKQVTADKRLILTTTHTAVMFPR